MTQVERKECRQTVSWDGQELGKYMRPKGLRDDSYGKGENAERKGRRWQEASTRHVGATRSEGGREKGLMVLRSHDGKETVVCDMASIQFARVSNVTQRGPV